MGWLGLSKRWEMVWLLFSGVLVVYTLRVNMSVACVDMADDLGWSEAEKGLVLSSFYWGYALGQIPASRLAQIYGAKWIFGLSVAIPSFLTLFVPMAARSSLAGALALRMMIGFFESASFPMVYHYIPVWIPIDEKTFLIPVVLSGMYMGEIIGFSLSGVLVASDIWIGGKFYGGWPSVFYVFGLVGVVWFPFWAYLAHDTPESHPGITKEELLVIRKGKRLGTLRDHDVLESLVDSKDGSSAGGHSHTINVIHSDLPVDDGQLLHGAHDRAGHYSSIEANEDVVDHKERQISQISEDGHGVEFASRTPWKAIFTHPASLTLLFNAWTAGWIGFTLVSEMPSYLTDILGFNLTSAGILCVFPFLALFVSSLTFGKIFNYLQLYHSWRVRTVRQVANYISLGGSSLALVVCAYLDNKYAAYAFMILALYFYGATVASLACAYSDASPNYSPILNSIGNTIGAVAGIVGPLVVAAFTEQYPGVEGWRAAFFLTVAFAIISLGMWSLWQSSEIVPAINNPKHR